MNESELAKAIHRATQNMFEPGGYIEDRKMSDKQTLVDALDKAVWDARLMATFIKRLLEQRP